jgi:hypothetical protein
VLRKQWTAEVELDLACEQPHAASTSPIQPPPVSLILPHQGGDSPRLWLPLHDMNSKRGGHGTIQLGPGPYAAEIFNVGIT